MTPRAPIVPFRANEEDKQRLDFLKEKTGLSMAGVIRLAIKRLFDYEKKQDK